MDSKFFVKYSHLWKKGDQDDSQRPGASSLLITSRMRKRQFEAVNELNDIMFSIIVDNARKVSIYTMLSYVQMKLTMKYGV